MASAFHMQLRAAELQNVSERAGEAFGHLPDLDDGNAKQPAPRRALLLMLSAGAILLAALYALT